MNAPAYFLTNTLEPPRDFSDRFAFDNSSACSRGQNGQRNKEQKSLHRGHWKSTVCRFLIYMTDHSRRIVDAYKVVNGEALKERKLWLQDDYVKFIRSAQITLEKTGTGILGYITNHGYLDNPTFRGMRQSLLRSFQKLLVLDLHGNTKKKEIAPDGSADKNVFDIQQGVAIGLFVRKLISKDIDEEVLRGTVW